MKDAAFSNGRGLRQPPSTLAIIVRRLRKQNEQSIAQLAEHCQLAPSTLSKIENGQMSPTYETILSLANGLDVDVSELFSNKPGVPITGRRSINAAGSGAIMKTEHYEYELLCADIAKKKIVPLLTKINARSVDEFKPFSSHPGEEFIYILEGSVMLYTELYSPSELNVGDSCYYDSTMGHAIVCTSDEPATVLWVCSNVVSPLHD
ncbi:helix-turn-helix domain-containing protein [Cohaesibacter marisflavi]|uniref:helix-turn-helix domain-containing protein n=1 Tax=Cohaesibacter marisflavi TaxID=655353 RepID=UPI0029C9966F|nr:XRE family transcriptional regulator [Cohaesibacter marisflavi]